MPSSARALTVAYLLGLPSALALSTASHAWEGSGAPIRSRSISADTTADRGRLERGRYLVIAGNCASCHTRPGGAPFAGGQPFSTAFGVLYSSNITPDPNTGIGHWSASDLRRAMHEGIARDGRPLFPAFPYTSFTKISDDDVDAIYRYLRSIAPVRYTHPANSVLFHLRWGMYFWNWLFFRPGRFQPEARRSSEWNRGAYLVMGLGHCDACHTPRNLFMAEIPGKAYTGGSLCDRVIGDRLRRWSAVNLTSARSGLAAWSLAELTAYLKDGFAPTRAGTFGPMNDVILNSLTKLSSGDVRAIAVYLKSLPPQQSSGVPAPEQPAKAGARIYNEACADCHGSSGEGAEASAPPLAGSAIVQSSDAASLINIVLYGPEPLKALSFDDWMRPYKDVLSDAQAADVINFIRGSWGNRAPPVTRTDIAKQR